MSNEQNNLKVYTNLRVVPEEAQRKISGGRLNGFTDINSMWRIKRLTEFFGPCGKGWWTENERYWTVPGADGTVAAFCELDLVYKLDGDKSERVHGIGGSMFVAKETKGLYTDDEAFKKAKTDAIGTAGKMLGLGADVYFQNDKTKYKEETFKCSKCGKDVHDVQRRDGTIWSYQNVVIYGLIRWGKILCDECQSEQSNEDKKSKSDPMLEMKGLTVTKNGEAYECDV